MELMSPAGSMASAKAAIGAGADAIYLGVSGLSHQRDQCKNFSDSQLVEIAELARAKGVKIYLTFNSSYNKADFDGILEKIRFASTLDIEGAILADIGLVRVVAERHPQLKLLYSIQGECANVETAFLLKDIGVTRIVLERNVTIDEAKEIKDATGLEVELFVYGFQCNSHDSLCYMGDYWSEEPCKVYCTQKVRFPEIPGLDKPKRYLFMQYYSGIKYIPQFREAGIDGLKLEGRQRSSWFAGQVTHAWRLAIDHEAKCHAEGRPYVVQPEWMEILEEAAHGFQVTDGFFRDGDYSRTIIEEPSLRSKVAFAKDTVRTMMETLNYETMKRELQIGWRRAQMNPELAENWKRKRFSGLK